MAVPAGLRHLGIKMLYIWIVRLVIAKKSMKKVNLHLLLAVCCLGLGIKSASAQNSKGYWQLIQGDPFPDSVTQIVAGPGSLVYMATSDKGVFKSTDEGENWKQINTGLNGDLDITMLTLGPKGDLLARNDVGDILYSKDESTWTNDGIPWHSQFPGASATTFAFDMNGVPYVGSRGAGIYKMDSIGNWDQIVSPAIIPGVRTMLFDNQNRLIIHFDTLYRMKADFSAFDTMWPMSDVNNTEPQLLRTTWGSVLVVNDTLYELTDQLQKISRNGIGAIIADSIGNLYGYYDAYNPWDWMEKSTDKGVTWNTATIPSGANITYGGRFLEATSQGFINAGNGYPELSVSFDTAFGFISIHELDNKLQINEIDVDKNQQIQAFDELGGIWSSSNQGNTWMVRKPRQNVQGKLLDDGKYYVTRTWPPMVSDDGINYRSLSVPSGIEGTLSASLSGDLWLSYGQAHFMRSVDGGIHWNEIAHFTDSGSSQVPGGDSAVAENAIERGPYIWLATYQAIHLTSDDGATWHITTPHDIFFGIAGGKGYTIVTHTSGEGIHWLSPGEDADSSWLNQNGMYAEDIDGSMLQFTWPTAGFAYYPQALIRQSKSGEIIDTLCLSPDSLTFSLDQIGVSQLAIDSFGNIFAAAGGGLSGTGLYKFISTAASVTQQLPPSDNLTVSLSNDVLTISSSSDEIQSVELIDVTGRSMLEIPSVHSTTVTASVASLANGFYFVKTETTEGSVVRKVMIVR
jgi:hypothetical protein